MFGTWYIEIRYFGNRTIRHRERKMTVNKLKKALSMLLIAAFMLSASGCSMIDYVKAEKLRLDGDYAAAQEMYIALGDYKDSAELANGCGYQTAKDAYDSEDYETAAGLFDKLGSYRNSAQLKQKCDDHMLEAKLVGKWVSGNVDVAEILQATFDELAGDGDVDMTALAANCNFDDCVLVIYAEFTDKGTFIMSYDSAAFVDPFIAALKDGFQVTMEDALRQDIIDSGITMEEVEAVYGTSDIDEVFAADMGFTIEDYFNAIVSRDDLISLYDSLIITGTYNVEDGNISITVGTETETADYDSESDTITMSGENLTDGEITFTHGKVEQV